MPTCYAPKLRFYLQRPATLMAVIMTAAILSGPVLAEQPESKGAIAITNVNVISMVTDVITPGQTVLVEAARIKAIGQSSDMSLPADVQQIDGTGKYLLPGLADMHVHLLPGPGNAEDPAGRQMKLFLVHGVTTVRGMIGLEDHIKLRDRIEQNEVLGPTIICAGPPLMQMSAPNADAATQAVLQQKMLGYDLIKVHEGLQPETYAAIVETAAKLDIPIAGHVTATLGLDRVLKARQSSLEHLDGMLRQSIPADAPVNIPQGQFMFGAALDHVDAGMLADWAAKIQAAGVRSTPTQALFERIAAGEKVGDLMQLPEMKYVPAAERAMFAKQVESLANLKAPPAKREKFIALRREAIRKLYDGGAPLLAGSDSPQFFFVAGAALHHELQSLSSAGLPRYAVLAAATRNAGEYSTELKLTDIAFGTVEVGKRADLLLLEQNPLEDLDNLSQIAGVTVRGQWLSREKLDALRKELAAHAAG